MGFSVADFTNGRTLFYNDPVVGFLVSYQGYKHPFDKNPAYANVRPTSRFALESFPLFGTYEDCGGMQVEACALNSESLPLALKMTVKESWEDLQADVLRRGTCGSIRGRPQFYGLALMHRDTFDHLVAAGDQPSHPLGQEQLQAQCQADVSAVEEFAKIAVAKKGVFEEYLAAVKASKVNEKDQRAAYAEVRKWEGFLRVATLSHDSTNGLSLTVPESEEEILIPAFAKIDASGQLLPLTGEAFIAVLRSEGYRDFMASREAVDRQQPISTSYLAQLRLRWTLNRMLQALDVLGISVEPSRYMGDQVNYDELCRFQLAGIAS